MHVHLWWRNTALAIPCSSLVSPGQIIHTWFLCCCLPPMAMLGLCRFIRVIHTRCQARQRNPGQIIKWIKALHVTRP